MKLMHAGLMVPVSIAAIAVSTAIAQDAPRLRFEVTVDGSLVAGPEMRVQSGGEGRIVLDEKHGEARITFVPSVRDDRIAIAFDITDGDKRLRPTLVITKNVPGSIQWTSRVQGRTVRLAVSWVQ